MILNLIRNKCSNLLELNFSDNLFEYEEFSSALTKVGLEKESQFGNLHFKLRILNLRDNPMKDFYQKVNKLLD